jgi:hypothetical protein
MTMSARAPWRRRRWRPAWLAAILLLGAASQAEQPAQSPVAAGEASPVAAPVALERLLKLPDSLDYSLPSRGGATRPEWRARFESLRGELDEQRQGLEEAQAEIEKAAGSVDAWQVGPAIPGVEGGGDGPLDYRLRQQIRRHRAEIQRLERDLRALEVEANLVSVPPDWRE